MVTLWQLTQSPYVAFNRHQNIGLHHVAFNVEREELDALYQRIEQSEWPIEFVPQPLKNGTSYHMMITGPDKLRIEFICPNYVE